MTHRKEKEFLEDLKKVFDKHGVTSIEGFSSTIYVCKGEKIFVDGIMSQTGGNPRGFLWEGNRDMIVTTGDVDESAIQSRK